MPASISLIGKRFGRWTVTRQQDKRHRGNVMWECDCDCGSKGIVPSRTLNSGVSQSCGCLHKEITVKANTVHGLACTPTGKCWYTMISRCYNTADEKYKRYGEKGVRVCEFLRASPVNLVILIGLRPENKRSVDRIKNEFGYSCGQCSECLEKGLKFNIRWADDFDQNRNKTNNVVIDFDGQSMCASEWAEKLGVNRSTVLTRWRKHGSPYGKPK